MQKFHGTMVTVTPQKVPKIWEQHLATGHYKGRNDNEYASKISLWVPQPRHGGHIEGIFIRLSNPSGTAYARLSSDEFAELYTFFRHNYQPAVDALAEAKSLVEIYRSAERTLLEATGRLKGDTSNQDESAQEQPPGAALLEKLDDLDEQIHNIESIIDEHNHRIEIENEISQDI